MFMPRDRAADGEDSEPSTILFSNIVFKTYALEKLLGHKKVFYFLENIRYASSEFMRSHSLLNTNCEEYGGSE